MKSLLFSAAALAVQQVAGHATFQDLWVNGVDEICIPLMTSKRKTNFLLPGLLCPPTTFEHPSDGCDKYRYQV